ncbi:MAG: hypothetical protein LBI01_06860 [Elusimicrobium sp.]|jgi:hypothetical protein|nr:hypothetical protein [Elusimicrobium sp.]
MRTLGIAVFILVFGAVIGMVIEKAAALALTGQSYLFFTRVFGGVGVHPLSVNITFSGALGLLISYLLVMRLVTVLK